MPIHSTIDWDISMQSYMDPFYTAIDRVNKSTHTDDGICLFYDFCKGEKTQELKKIMTLAAINLAENPPANFNQISDRLQRCGICVPEIKDGYISGPAQIKNTKPSVSPSPTPPAAPTSNTPPSPAQTAPIVVASKCEYPFFAARVKNPEAFFAKHAKALVEGIREIVPNPDPNSLDFSDKLEVIVNKVLKNNALETKFAKALQKIHAEINKLLEKDDNHQKVYEEFLKNVSTKDLTKEFRWQVHHSVFHLLDLN